ncbi:MAG: GntP family permease, partial [Myxococcota bacterium]
IPPRSNRSRAIGYIAKATPMPYFGTTLYAAPGFGLLAGALMAAGGILWLSRRAKTLQASSTDTQASDEGAGNAPSFGRAIAPLLCMLVLNFVFTKFLIPSWDTSYLQSDAFGNKQLKDVLGIWSIVLAMSAAVVLLLVSLRSHLGDTLKSVNEGTLGSLLPIFNTASEVGFGATIASLPAFEVVKSAILGIFPKTPLVSEAIAVNVLAGITGSASGGMSIALEALSANYLERANASGISPELLHRVASLSAGGLDTLPHNGAVITLLAICGLTHRQSYLDIFIVAVAIPFGTTAVVVVLGSLLGSF